MQIRGKVTVLLSLLFAILIVAQWLIQQHQVLPRFVALERDSARTDIERVAMALHREQQALMTRTGDWANWYDLWQYADGHNPKFAKANLTDGSFASTHVDYLAIVDRNGHSLWKHGPISESGATIALHFNADDQLEPAWQETISKGKAVSGLVSTDRGVLITAACPILDGSGHGAPHGMVVMGWLLNAAELQRLGTQAQVQLDMRLWGRAQPSDPRLKQALASGQSLISETDSSTRIERSFANLSGVPLVVLGIRIPRAISHRGSEAVRYSMQMLAGAAGIVLLALFLILRRTVLSPLSRVIRHAQRIARSNDLSARLGEKRRDEIGALARVFDEMVERLDTSRRELAERSFESGVAENARGILHNLGNAITPLSVNITNIRDRLERIPVNDILDALEELQVNGDADPERRQDLEQFVRLGAFEAAQALREFGGRMDGVAEQAQVVQAVLAEQRRHQQGDPVRQSITPAELVARSLRQIAPSLRDRLDVQLSPNLAAGAAHSLPSTTLGMVIANLAQNAAEAANQSGIARVHLCFDMSVVKTAAGAALKLTVSDDGPGVSADQLAHLFQKGYSTKPKATNSGLGLHWCANTMRAMGGSIRAIGNGSGRGLQFEILVPLRADSNTAEQAA
jgi:two-component system, NtrC family, sensor kinase